MNTISIDNEIENICSRLKSAGEKTIITIFDRVMNRGECKGAYFPAFRDMVKIRGVCASYMIHASLASPPIGMMAKTLDRNF